MIIVCHVVIFAGSSLAWPSSFGVPLLVGHPAGHLSWALMNPGLRVVRWGVPCSVLHWLVVF